jgi:hypothetical protein
MKVRTFHIADLIGRTVQLVESKDTDGECKITAAFDTDTGDVFMLDITYLPEVKETIK